MTEHTPDAEIGSHAAPELSDEAFALARRIRDSMDAWVGRMAGAAGAGRSATSVARMATARAISELRILDRNPAGAENEPQVADYLRRARSLLNQAAHDIERNRYSLQLMDSQMHRLDDAVKRIFPEAAQGRGEPEAGEASDGPSSDATGGADDGGAGREVPPS